MFWNKAKTAAEAAAWAERLEAGQQNETTLAMAAQLAQVQLQSPALKPEFKARLRQRLVVNHQETLPTLRAEADQRLRQARVRQVRWRLLGLGLVLILLYWQRLQIAGLFIAQIDDWQYGFLAPFTFIPFAPIAERLIPFVLPATVLAGVYLLYRLGQWRYGQWQVQRQATAYWPPLAHQGLWLSSALTVLIIGGLIYVGQQAAVRQIRPYYSPAMQPSNVVHAPAPITPQSNFAVAEESIALAPAAESVQLFAFEPTNQNFQWSLRQNATAKLGFAVGGAKEINNFRANIAQGYLPLATDITVEGLLYDYYFATGQQVPCAQLFCPSYAQARSRDPISGEQQHFLAVGLNSGLSTTDFTRKRLNLVVVLDISDSMGEAFTQYYYDQNGLLSPGSWDTQSKLKAATAAIAGLLDQLAPEDQLAIVLFNDQAHLAKALRKVGETDLASIKQHVLALQETGGTNLEAGYRLGSELLAPYVDADPAVYENRIILLTDAQPNAGDTTEAGLQALTQANAARRIYTTMIGVGVDFNTELVEGLTKIRGANYYAIHSSADFLRRLGEEFSFMVTPLLFDLTLTFNSPDWVIEQVYGSPEAQSASGEIMRINTLFPSASSNGEVKGGLVLLQLRPRNAGTVPTGAATLTVTYADRSGQVQSSAATVTLEGDEQAHSDTYDNLGIRKGILLVRYANLLQNWINDKRGSAAGGDEWLYPSVNPERGIPLPQAPVLNQWERQSLPLQISPAYQAIFAQFKAYFAAEMEAVEDATLQQELSVLEQLAG